MVGFVGGVLGLLVLIQGRNDAAEHVCHDRDKKGKADPKSQKASDRSEGTEDAKFRVNHDVAIAEEGVGGGAEIDRLVPAFEDAVMDEIRGVAPNLDSMGKDQKEDGQEDRHGVAEAVAFPVSGGLAKSADPRQAGAEDGGVEDPAPAEKKAAPEDCSLRLMRGSLTSTPCCYLGGRGRCNGPIAGCLRRGQNCAF